MEEKEESFLVKLTTGGRITIPQLYREKLGLEEDTLVRITVKKEEA